MASAVVKLKNFATGFKIAFVPSSSCRTLNTCHRLSNEVKDNWFSKVFVRKIEPTKESHSRLLSDKDVIYELQTHNIRPDMRDKYLSNYEKHCQLMASSDINAELVGSWSVIVGDQDQAFHVWRYIGGYAEIDKACVTLAKSNEHRRLWNEQGQCIRARHNQYVLTFSFWPQIESRKGPNVYEVRNYVLKPGTMIEWGNNWARAISFRRENEEAFAGFFSQIGRLYNVHHVWACFVVQRTQTCSHVRKPVKPLGENLVGMNASRIQSH
ncbi:protein NipSnap isoform X2 [Daphnia magna]|uniref:protein NipSnap isoform X2 n=1 Tax=Daphnia magna TaxID=35525 RepID=UPI001E1BAFAE|nr:protein NipSnap isoform X2 [Daphnia magna]